MEDIICYPRVLTLASKLSEDTDVRAEYRNPDIHVQKGVPVFWAKGL